MILLLAHANYLTSVISAQMEVEENTLAPRPELNQTRGDITLIYLSPNNFQCMQPIYDPFFSSHLKHTFGDGSIVYLNDGIYNSNGLCPLGI